MKILDIEITYSEKVLGVLNIGSNESVNTHNSQYYTQYYEARRKCIFVESCEIHQFF